MAGKQKVEATIHHLIDLFRQYQSVDGAWRYCLESGPTADAYAIVLLRTLEMEEEALIQKLAERLLATQAENGAWKLFHDDNGNLNATVEAYYALLYSRYLSKEHPKMEKAKQFILQHGGAQNVTGLLTEALLVLTGQLPWPKKNVIPIDVMLLPTWFPVNLFDLSGHARVHLVPLMIAAHQHFSLKHEHTPDLSDLFLSKKERKPSFSPLSIVIQSWKVLAKTVPFLSRRLQKKAVRKAELFMLKRLEPDGTLLTYSTSTMLMIFALLSLGYTKESPVVAKAIEGIKTLLCKRDGHVHLQVATSTVWDTALISYALQEASVPATDATVQKTVHYLVSRQQNKKTDWRIHNPEGEPGGWGFSDVNTKYPDLDCTAMALRALSKAANNQRSSEQAWNRGLDWLLSMQNDDGGWPAFEKNTDKKMMTFISFEGAADFVIDPSTPDLTGRVLQFLGTDAALKEDHPAVKKAVKWLKRQQKGDGSWFGRWGISFIHGTSAAVLGLLAAGVPKNDPAIKKAQNWMRGIQNKDGGWGESAMSDVKKEYIPLGASTPSQAAWALEMLIALEEKPTTELTRGIEYVIQSLQKEEWTNTYPTGGGLPGNAYFYYPSLNDAWGLLVLAAYKHKFLS